MSEMTYLQRRLAMKNGLLKSTDGKKGSSDDQGTPNSEDQPKSGPTPAKGGKPGKGQKKPLQRGKAPKKVSKKRAKELREYKPVRSAFLKANPTCGAKLPGCTGRATQIHHQAGKEGKRLIDINDFLGICDNCHRIITEDSKGAIADGHSKTRLGKSKKPTT
jgi:hypothetical protein